MTEQNPNYVPVDWTDEQTQDQINDLLARPVLGDVTVADVCEKMRETSTLNSAGEPVKVDDQVTHLAVPDHRGHVIGIGPAMIAGVEVANAVHVRWPSDAGIPDNDIESWHHVDNLRVTIVA